MVNLSGDYIKHDRTVQTTRIERHRKKEKVTIWIADKQLHIRLHNKKLLTPTVTISDDNRALTIMENAVKDLATNNYQTTIVDNIITIPAKYARCRQRDSKKKVIMVNAVIVDPAYKPTFKSDVDLGTTKLIIDRKHIP